MDAAEEADFVGVVIGRPYTSGDQVQASISFGGTGLPVVLIDGFPADSRGDGQLVVDLNLVLSVDRERLACLVAVSGVARSSRVPCDDRADEDGFSVGASVLETYRAVIQKRVIVALQGVN